jgi:hypothetical protein
MKKYRRQLWWTAIIAALLFVPTFLYFMLLEGIYFDQRPRESHPQNGQIMPYVVKNTTVYITDSEANTSTWLYRFDMGMLGILAVCGILAGGLDLSRRNSN